MDEWKFLFDEILALGNFTNILNACNVFFSHDVSDFSSLYNRIKINKH